MLKITLDELKASPGLDLGASDWLLIDQDRISRFADVTEDRQWIHVDETRAKETGFGGTIAHGYLTLSLVSGFIQELLEITDAAMTINYGLDRLRFRAPVPAGSRVRGAVRIDSAQERAGGVIYRLNVSVEIEGESRPALTCEAIFLAYR